MLEMYVRKTVSRKPKNAAIISNNRRKSRGVSAKARKGKQAPTKSTKQKRRGRKHGGSIRKHKHKPKRKQTAEQLDGVPKTEKQFYDMTGILIEIIKKNNLETVSEIAAVVKDEVLEGKTRKEKAATLNGLVRHLGKHPGRYATYAIVIVIAIFYLFKSLGLNAHISSRARSIWESVFSVNHTAAKVAVVPASADAAEADAAKVAAKVAADAKAITKTVDAEVDTNAAADEPNDKADAKAVNANVDADTEADTYTAVDEPNDKANAVIDEPDVKAVDVKPEAKAVDANTVADVATDGPNAAAMSVFKLADNLSGPEVVGRNIKKVVDYFNKHPETNLLNELSFLFISRNHS